MDREIPKSHHLCQLRAELGLDEIFPYQDCERLPAFTGNAEMFAADEHVGEVNGNFAGADDVQYCGILQEEVCLESGAGLGQCPTRLRHATLNGCDFLGDRFVDHGAYPMPV